MTLADHEVDYAKWRDETLNTARMLTDILHKQNEEFQDALRQVIHDIPANKAIQFITLANQGFFEHVLGYTPILNLTEQDI
jgi:hypothetical protein